MIKYSNVSNISNSPHIALRKRSHYSMTDLTTLILNYEVWPLHATRPHNIELSHYKPVRHQSCSPIGLLLYGSICNLIYGYSNRPTATQITILKKLIQSYGLFGENQNFSSVFYRASKNFVFGGHILIYYNVDEFARTRPRLKGKLALRTKWWAKSSKRC